MRRFRQFTPTSVLFLVLAIASAQAAEEPPADPSSVQMWLEAEEGQLTAPMSVLTDPTAAAGAYVAVPRGTGNILNVAKARGSVRYTFSVPVSDTYVLWGRVQATGSNYDSFFMRLDGGTAFVWDTQQGNIWLWDQVNNRDQADPVKVMLTAGTHTLEILQREDGTQLDRLLITNDLAFMPTGLGEPAALDRDGDGLSDTDEVVRYGTDPARFDSDGDQLSDGVEILQIGTDPLNADSDDDGLEDGEEVQFHATDPLVADSDGDGVEDGEEVLQGTDPLVATNVEGDSDDDDGTSTDGEDSEPAPVPAPPAEGTTVLGVQASQFTLNGMPTFLYGITYAAGLGAPQAFIEQDLDEMQRFGINWLRVWATRNRFNLDTSAVDAAGQPRPTFMAKLKWLVAECERRNMVVDITLTRRDQPAFYDLAMHRQAVETLVTELRDYRNWYLDMANERNGEASFTELRQLRNAVKGLDPQRLVTASHSFDISPADLQQYLFTAQVDFLTPHRQRSPEANQETEVVTRRYLEQMTALGRVVPVHYQEPLRRGYSSWQPQSVDFVDNLRLSWQGGAAGWSFHNGDQRNPLLTPDRQPRRSADMRERRLFDQLDTVERQALEELQDLTTRLIFHK